MAQSKNDGVSSSWAGAAARCGYAIHNGQPLIGISGKGIGFIVPLPEPDYFTVVTDEGVQENVFRAVAGHALRVGQAKVKASKAPSREDAIAGVLSAVAGTYKPSKERSSDILDSTAMRLFEARIETRVAALGPDALVIGGKAEPFAKVVAGTVAAQLKLPRGQEVLKECRAQAAESGTYVPSTKDGGEDAIADIGSF